MRSMYSKIAATTVIVFMAFTVASCQEKAMESSGTGVISVDVNVIDFATILDTAQTGIILDVRTDQEFASGHISGAQQMNFYDSDFKSQLETLDPDVPVYIYCRSGGRSGKAASMMKAMGFRAVYNLEGGVGAWARTQPLAK
jgi:phage shock protein E